ncbi:MAG: histidinol phosphate phosphatase domain-containing protein [Candidatus Omnitrophica bacterium]|nr:histidinol phosphate phosphatase domain-containing protein [Candidatus Omnitrophota bacterium]
MIDLHTHSLLSDGVLVPSELVRRAYVAGYKAIAITDHVDHSNIDMVLGSIVKVAKVLNKYWDIEVIPGAEITYVPIEVFSELAKYAREKGAKLLVAHGESPVEPVITGTNKAAIMAGVDILAHPGYISLEDARLAAEKGVCLEITTRRGHSETNGHVFNIGTEAGCKMVLNTDTHMPEDLLTLERQREFLDGITDSEEEKGKILANAEEVVKNVKL